MTDLRQAAQQALECIERLNLRGFILADFEDEVYAAIAALKAVLEQPEQRKPLTDVLVPLEVLEAAASSLDSFCGNLGWGDADLQNMDNLFAVIEQHKAAHNIKEQP